jgi:ribosomal-protein-alanine N-acetyltransferase
MNSAAFPIFKTERLILRQLSIDDQRDIFDLRADPIVNKFIDRQLCKSNSDAINFIKKINDSIQKGDAYYWAITLKDTNIFAGTICLFDFSKENDSCEIGYELMTKFQGLGIMTEAVDVVIEFSIQTLKFKKIIAHTHCENQHSTNILLKFNFVKSTKTNKYNPNLNVFTLTEEY